MANFTWGDGGSQMTPEAIAAQRKVAEALTAEGMNYSPILSPWQGAARVSQALLGGYEGYRADQADKTNRDADQKLLASLFTPQAPTTPAAAPVDTGPTGLAPPAASIKGSPIAPPPTSDFMPNVGSLPAQAPAVAGTPNPGLNDAIAKVAAARGVDPSYLTRTAMVESGGNVNSANPTSSARGPFQFINSTARQYGLSNPNDAYASTDAAARLTLDNKAALTKALGREPTQGELYLAHQQGSGGAAKLLANPNAPVEAVIGPDAARLNGAQPGMTAGQFAQKWTSKFPGDAPTASAPAPAAPSAAPGGISGVNPALIAAISSPYASEGVKKIAGILLQNQLSSDAVTTVDLGNNIGIMDKRGNLLRTMPKGEPNKGPEFGQIGEDEYGGKTYGWRNPRDQSVTPYNAAPAATAAKPTAPGTAPTIAIPQAPPGVNPKVWRDEQTRIAADAAGGKLTEVQANSTMYANRMEDAEKNYQTHEPQIRGTWTAVKDRALDAVSSGAYNPIPKGLTNPGLSQSFQNANQAKSQFITAMLRRESGAAISPSEFERYDQEFFPQQGNPPEVIEQKANARRIAIAGMKKSAGPGYTPPNEPAAAGPSIDDLVKKYTK